MNLYRYRAKRMDSSIKNIVLSEAILTAESIPNAIKLLKDNGIICEIEKPPNSTNITRLELRYISEEENFGENIISKNIIAITKLGSTDILYESILCKNLNI